MAPTYQLAVKHVFDRPNPREKRYANHLVHAAWQGSRIILRQTSPESEGIFDFMIQLHKACEGQWSRFVDVDQDYVISSSDLDAFLRYAAQFLAHVGNYHGVGDRKMFSTVSVEVLRKMVGKSSRPTRFLETTVRSNYGSTRKAT